ncbi:hypothetical protein MO867_02495 [Microbulbifer sp. OS29]|uniref:Uncharacterized protein n=1 Tax=Microbulbifer okhotskensis TaxID=2926617 RepID=A0A9X2ELF6_9GAMM|nr:hypothetical protein [Microbulbifer okhotskensis]MCO1333200.1 hypothetical protein [Microbulbifer okhotskensis]
MSLRHLNEQITQCSHDIEQQRLGVMAIVDRQQQEAQQRLQSIPLPLMLGLALIAGFAAEKLWQLPSTSQLVHFALSLRAF